MPVTQHHGYYSTPASDRMRVHAVWSALRGKGPAL
jgi:hypothetical protein